MSKELTPADALRQYVLEVSDSVTKPRSLDEAVTYMQGIFGEQYSRKHLETVARSGLRAMRDVGEVRTFYDEQVDQEGKDAGEPLFETKC